MQACITSADCDDIENNGPNVNHIERSYADINGGESYGNRVVTELVKKVFIVTHSCYD